ncbi:MAG: hypothetical protein M3071_12635 [Actinomycetota bacterium]|nr:hypothetical protein [Actinomycetota bacterium]
MSRQSPRSDGTGRGASRFLGKIAAAAVAASCFLVCPALADASIAAHTGAAHVYGKTTVTATGTLNDNGRVGSYHFEYIYTDHGLLYDQGSPAKPAAAKHTVQAVKMRLPSVASGQRYKYRLVLTIGHKNVYGAWKKFRTPGPPGTGGPPVAG